MKTALVISLLSCLFVALWSSPAQGCTADFASCGYDQMCCSGSCKNSKCDVQRKRSVELELMELLKRGCTADFAPCGFNQMCCSGSCKNSKCEVQRKRSMEQEVQTRECAADFAPCGYNQMCCSGSCKNSECDVQRKRSVESNLIKILKRGCAKTCTRDWDCCPNESCDSGFCSWY